MRLICLLGAAALALGPVQAAAQEWSDLRDNLLDTATNNFSGEGYGVAGFTHEGSLNEGADETVDLRLANGADVIVVGVCDGDCSDLDLTLINPRGSEVVSDVLTDDVPILRTTAGRDGIYRVKVAMASCSVDPCYYAVQVFAK